MSMPSTLLSRISRLINTDIVSLTYAGHLFKHYSWIYACMIYDIYVSTCIDSELLFGRWTVGWDRVCVCVVCPLALIWK